MLIAYEIKFFQIIRIWKKKKRKLQIVLVVASNQHKFFNRIKIIIIQQLGFAKIEHKVEHIKNYSDYGGAAVQFGLIEKSRKLSLLIAQKEISDISLHKVLKAEVVSDFHLILAQNIFYEILNVLRKYELSKRIFKGNNYTLLLNVPMRYMEIIGPEISVPAIFYEASKIKKALSSNLIGAFFGIILMLGKRFISIGPQGYSEINTISTLYSGFESERIDIRNNISWFIKLRDSQLKLYTLGNLKLKNFFSLRSRTFQNQISILHPNKPYFSKAKIFKCSRREVLQFIFLLMKLNSKKYGVNEKLRLFSLISRYIWELESNYHFVTKFNCRVFVYEDDHFVSHVMNSLAKLDQIETIKLQYSNIGMKSLFMLSNPSKMLVFSDNFNSYFSDSEFKLGPKKYIQSGYPLNIDSGALLDRSKELRKMLESYGASYIIGVFDESVQNDDDLWAWKTKSEHLTDLESLCKFVLSNNDVGVIFKTQFIRNNPNNLFPDNQLIAKALSTKRIIFPWSGKHRNLILPCEIALASNICVGDIVGGTASLEAALCGVQSILIDSMNFGIKNREIYYAHEGIVFKDLKSSLEAISQYRFESGNKKSLGNWSLLLSQLRILNDNMQKKINEEIKLSMNRWAISE